MLHPPYCFNWYVCMRSGSNWPMIGRRPCAYACAYVNPVFTSQRYNISISISTRRVNLSVFLVLMLIMHWWKPGLRFQVVGKYNKWVGNQTAKISFGLFLFYFPMKVGRGHIRGSRGKPWTLALIRCLFFDVLQSEALPCMTASWITALISFLD